PPVLAGHLPAAMRLTERRDLRVDRFLCDVAVRNFALSWRAVRHSAPSIGERCTPAVHLLHDLGPEDDPGLQSRTGAIRRSGRTRRLVRAIPDVQNQRLALVAGSLVAVGALHRLAVPRRPVRLARTAGRDTRHLTQRS